MRRGNGTHKERFYAISKISRTKYLSSSGYIANNHLGPKALAHLCFQK